jgi:phytoene/squalene synthetase
VRERSRPGLRALITIYSRLLERIEECRYEVFSRRVALSSVEKCWIVMRAWFS